MHTKVNDENRPLGTHAWITVEKDGRTRDYSLFPDGVIEGRDEGAEPTASFRTKLTPDQERKLEQVLLKHEIYKRETNNCAHFTAGVCRESTGIDLPITHSTPNGVGGIRQADSPVGLQQSIRARSIDKDKPPAHLKSDGPQNLSPAQQEMRAMREAARASDLSQLLAKTKDRHDPGDRSR